jgi:hypothetical protein
VNGGTCRLGKCVCPNGYEGRFCDTLFNAKFVGKWDVSEVLIGSSNDTVGVKADSLYSVSIAPSTVNASGLSSPTAFFIDSMLGNYKYKNISCVVDTTTSLKFYLQGNQLINGGVLTIYSGTGTIDATHNKITGEYVRNRLGSSSKIYDTLAFTMTRTK